MEAGQTIQIGSHNIYHNYADAILALINVEYN
jgi:hypothetical protein